ncbi:hypothetical protein [Acidaminococcus sp.]|uniref:hypothetical protein n=1 Tax=Acidaminococcus sp. TaxID=1872103 RepID=UPI003AB648B3
MFEDDLCLKASPLFLFGAQIAPIDAAMCHHWLLKSPRNDKKRDFEKTMGAGLPVFCLAFLSKDKERDTVGSQPYNFDEKGAAVAAPFMVLFLVILPVVPVPFWQGREG